MMIVLIVVNALINIDVTTWVTSAEEYFEDHVVLYDSIREVFYPAVLPAQNLELTGPDAKIEVLKATIQDYLHRTKPQKTLKYKTDGKPLSYICKLYRKEGKLKRHVMPKLWEDYTKELPESITLATQITIEKLSVLNELCQAWPGPLSVSIYIDRNGLQQLPDLLLKYPRILNRQDINIHVVIKKGAWYPVNFVRNVALEYSRTEYVFLLDADFIPSVGLHDAVLDMVQQGEWDPTKEVIVVPAFDFKVSPGEYFPPNKDALLELQKSGMVLDGTNSDRWFKSYRGTDYRKWRSTNTSYVATYEDGFEPYIIGKRSLMPLYDPRFLTRSRNKVQQLTEVYYKGFDFRVLPSHFVIHYPHIRGNRKVPYMKCGENDYRSFKKRIRNKYAARIDNEKRV